MGTGTLSPFDIFKMQVEAASHVEHHVPPIYIEAPLIYVLSHDCHEKIVPLIDKIAEGRAFGVAQSMHMPELDAHETFTQFANKCEQAAHDARHPKEECISADLPVGETEPGLILTLSQMSLQELQMIRTFAQLSRDDKLFLLEHPEVIEKLASGQIILEQESIRQEIDEAMEKDSLVGPDRQKYRILVKEKEAETIAKVRSILKEDHVALDECSEKEKNKYECHPGETPFTDVVITRGQEFVSYDPSKDGEHSNN